MRKIFIIRGQFGDNIIVKLSAVKGCIDISIVEVTSGETSIIVLEQSEALKLAETIFSILKEDQ